MPKFEEVRMRYWWGHKAEEKHLQIMPRAPLHHRDCDTNARAQATNGQNRAVSEDTLRKHQISDGD
jgi:hypothetical protein